MRSIEYRVEFVSVRRNASAVSELRQHRHARSPGGMQERAVWQGPSLAGLFFGRDAPDRGGDGWVPHAVVWDGGRGSAGSTPLAGVGGERTRNRNPEKTTKLLGGAHRMSAAMQVPNTIKSLNG